MAEPGSEPSEISLRAAEVAADASEAERPQDRRRLVEAFARAAHSGARVAGRGTRAARRRARAAGGGARSGTAWLAAQVTAMAPRLRVRNQAALREQFGGKSAEDIADALVDGAARAAATAGGVAGLWAVLPTLPAFPAEVAAETLVLVGIEIKLVAELHEAYGMPAEGNVAERMSAYVASWAHRRGVYMIPGGVVLVAGSPLARLLRRRLAARAGRSALSLGPLLTGAVVGAYLNGRETRRLGQDIRRDLRRRVLTGAKDSLRERRRRHPGERRPGSAWPGPSRCRPQRPSPFPFRAGPFPGACRVSMMRQVVVACAYRVPSGPVIWPEAVATRRPELSTCPVATTLGVSTVSGFTRFTFSSRVVYAWPGPSLECTAQDIAESSRAQKTPPWTDPIGLYRCSPTSSEKVTRPGST
jgi:hypothetical protein